MPWRGLRPLAASVAVLALAACTTGHSSGGLPSPTGSAGGGSQPARQTHASYRPGIAYASRSAHVYRGAETFCMRSPLSGTARYSIHAGRARFLMDIHGLPPKASVGLDWINNAVRGYMVGAFTTNAAGSYMGTADTFRPGEVRAVAIRFERANGIGLPGIGEPC
jgi:hypothetical protein